MAVENQQYSAFRVDSNITNSFKSDAFFFLNSSVVDSFTRYLDQCVKKYIYIFWHFEYFFVSETDLESLYF